MESSNTSEDGASALDELDDMDTPLAISPNIDAISSLQRKLQMVQESSLHILHSYERHSSPLKRSAARPHRASATNIIVPESITSAGCTPVKPQRSLSEPTCLANELEGEVSMSMDRVTERADAVHAALQSEADGVPSSTPHKHTSLMSSKSPEFDGGDDCGAPIASPVVAAAPPVQTRTLVKEEYSCPSPDHYSNGKKTASLYATTVCNRAPQAERTVDGYAEGSPQSSAPPSDLSPQSSPWRDYRAHTITGSSPQISPTYSPAGRVHSIAGTDRKIQRESLMFYEDDTAIAAPVLKEGFLMKRGYINTALQRRWCVLRGKVIYFYKQYRDKSVRGTINCDRAIVEVAVKKIDSMPFAFYIHTPNDK